MRTERNANCHNSRTDPLHDPLQDFEHQSLELALDLSYRQRLPPMLRTVSSVTFDQLVCGDITIRRGRKRHPPQAAPPGAPRFRSELPTVPRSWHIPFVRRRWKLFVALMSMVLIPLIVCVTLRTPEPRYKGQSLSAWLHNYDHAHTQIEEREAKQAIVNIGTNAVPFLLQYMRYTPRPWKRSITDALAKLKGMRFAGRFIPYSMTTDAVSVRAQSAAYAFDILGPAAAYAYPDIAQLACTATDPRASELATMVLIMRRADATNAIGFVLSNAPPPIRMQMIGRIATQRIGENESDRV